MNLTLFLALSAISEFSLVFQRNNESYQDILQFNNGSTIAHLYRVNSTISMEFESAHGLSVYQSQSKNSQLCFRWPHFINGEPMELRWGDPIDRTELNGYSNVYKCVMVIALAVLILIESPLVIKRMVAKYQLVPDTETCNNVL